MKRLTISVLLGALCYVALPPSYATECVLPPSPSKVPDGRSASDAEMRTALETMKEYNADVETYLKCLEFSVKQHVLNSSEETRLRNDAIDVLTRAANRFNEQVRTFNKAKSG